jgi:hypothetical protein
MEIAAVVVLAACSLDWETHLTTDRAKYCRTGRITIGSQEFSTELNPTLI